MYFDVKYSIDSPVNITYIREGPVIHVHTCVPLALYDIGHAYIHT
jgi:hypothetical protein